MEKPQYTLEFFWQESRQSLGHEVRLCPTRIRRAWRTSTWSAPSHARGNAEPLWSWLAAAPCRIGETVTHLSCRVLDRRNWQGSLSVGSFVTAKEDPGDVDVVLLMEDTFDLTSVSGEAALLFQHMEADAQVRHKRVLDKSLWCTRRRTGDDRILANSP